MRSDLDDGQRPDLPRRRQRGPIFNGTIAFGIVKGGNYARSGRCNFYYYMSTDFLPAGWSLLH